MKDIKCAMRDCQFNDSYGCMAQEIQVTDGASCRSYAPSERKNRDTLFEIGVEGAKPNYAVDTAVNCDANCLFQKNCRCVAVGITVLAEDRAADCVTYVKK
ncbi:MAG: DUF1540 domain-containing protein [Clostridiales bacterium]|jgi:hypothetical protein|nr:DUF1540 domain-containing protein [Clostridiales bacterium]